jgi:hypothetical protein
MASITSSQVAISSAAVVRSPARLIDLGVVFAAEFVVVTTGPRGETAQKKTHPEPSTREES